MAHTALKKANRRSVVLTIQTKEDSFSIEGPTGASIKGAELPHLQFTTKMTLASYLPQQSPML